MSPRRAIAVAMPYLFLLATVSLLFLQSSRQGHAEGSGPWPVDPDPGARVMIGTTTESLARDWYAPWDEEALDAVNEFEQLINKHVSIVHWYSDWEHNDRPDIDQLERVAERGSIPEITWEPWDAAKGFDAPQPAYRLRRIIAGDFDGLIRRWADTLAEFDGIVRLRFAHEMNGRWYPWSEVANGNRPGEYVRAWRHVHGIFTEAGAENVEWVWSPVVRQIKPLEYPGDDFVDRVGVSAYNGGIQLEYRPFIDFDQLVVPAINELGRIAPGKPIELSELGISEQGGSKAQWIRRMFEMLPMMPSVDAVIWFNLDKDSDWRIETSAGAVRAFAAGVRPPRYGQRDAWPARIN